MKHRAKPQITQQDTYLFQVESLSHEGRGIAHYGSHATHPQDKQGKKVFISFALPNEMVRAKITHQTKRFEQADCIEVVEGHSDLRVEPICPHYTVCGGCSMQHVAVEQQIVLKQQVLASHLKHFAGIETVEWLEPIHSLKTDYRKKARIGVRYLSHKKQLRVGFRERQTNRLVSIDRCAVLDQQFGSITHLKQVLQRLEGQANIGHIELAMGDQEIALVIRHTAELSIHDQQLLKQFAQQKSWQLYLHGKVLQRIDQINAPMYLHYSLNDFNVKFAFNPLDFTQVNATVNQQMVKLACQLLDLQLGERVLDLFCGLGNFSLPMAHCVGTTGQVIAVEGVEDMVARGQYNAALNQLNQVQFYAQDLTKDFSHQVWANSRFDAILIDPPRSGAADVLQYVHKFGAKRIVYVSCDPATLSRDAGILAKHHYQLKKVGVMDMFTHTAHVESIALFEKISEINDL